MNDYKDKHPQFLEYGCFTGLNEKNQLVLDGDRPIFEWFCDEALTIVKTTHSEIEQLERSSNAREEYHEVCNLHELVNFINKYIYSQDAYLETIELQELIEKLHQELWKQIKNEDNAMRYDYDIFVNDFINLKERSGYNNSIDQIQHIKNGKRLKKEMRKKGIQIGDYIEVVGETHTSYGLCTHIAFNGSILLDEDYICRGDEIQAVNKAEIHKVVKYRKTRQISEKYYYIKEVKERMVQLRAVFKRYGMMQYIESMKKIYDQLKEEVMNNSLKQNDIKHIYHQRMYYI